MVVGQVLFVIWIKVGINSIVRSISLDVDLRIQHADNEIEKNDSGYRDLRRYFWCENGSAFDHHRIRSSIAQKKTRTFFIVESGHSPLMFEKAVLGIVLTFDDFRLWGWGSHVSRQLPAPTPILSVPQFDGASQATSAVHF